MEEELKEEIKNLNNIIEEHKEMYDEAKERVGELEAILKEIQYNINKVL